MKSEINELINFVVDENVEGQPSYLDPDHRRIKYGKQQIQPPLGINVWRKNYNRLSRLN